MRAWILIHLFAITAYSGEATSFFQNFVPSQRSSVFTSRNAQYGLFLEDIKTSSQTGGKLRATIFNNTTRSPVWKTEIYAPNATSITPERILVSDRGDFFLMTVGMDTQWLLYSKNDQGQLLPRIDTTGPAALQMEDLLAFIDSVDGTNVVNVWHRNSDRWETSFLPSLAAVKVTPALAAQWNDRMRERILEMIHVVNRDKARRKLGTYSTRLSELATNVAPVVRYLPLCNTHYEFLALRRNPSDRSMLEELLVPRTDPPPVGLPAVSPWRGSDWTIHHSLGAYRDRWAYRFSSLNTRFIEGDGLLALFDQKISITNIIHGSFIEPLFYLGKATGKIQLPIPLTKKSGFIQLSLIPDTWNGKNSAFAQIATISDGSLVPLAPENFPPTNQITFTLETIHPGNYRLQAIWDKRSPFFNNTEHAGPGDYESAWSEPITITAGNTVSNLLIICTNRASAGEAYYAADDLSLRLTSPLQNQIAK